MALIVLKTVWFVAWLWQPKMKKNVLICQMLECLELSMAVIVVLSTTIDRSFVYLDVGNNFLLLLKLKIIQKVQMLQ